MCSENSSASLNTRQLSKRLKKALQGCSAQMTHFPMARASALVVATTSLVLGLTNTLRPGSHQPCPPLSTGQKRRMQKGLHRATVMFCMQSLQMNQQRSMWPNNARDAEVVILLVHG